MTLLKKIENLIRLGYKVQFSNEGLHFKISLEKEVVSKKKIDVSVMPLEGHFKEEKIVDCLSFMEDRFNKKTE